MKIRNAVNYPYENDGDIIYIVDICLKDNVALSTSGETNDNVIRFRSKKVFNDMVCSNVSNPAIYGELSILKQEFTSDELCNLLCALLFNADIEVEQKVVTKDSKGNDLGKRSFVNTDINELILNKSGIKAYYMALATLENIRDMEQIKKRIDLALED